MEPLNPYEIQELLMTLNQGAYPFPIGSLWTNQGSDQIFMVLHHANLPSDSGPIQCVVLQAMPDGSAWIQPSDSFLNSGWQNIGFVWDREVSV